MRRHRELISALNSTDADQVLGFFDSRAVISGADAAAVSSIDTAIGGNGAQLRRFVSTRLLQDSIRYQHVPGVLTTACDVAVLGAAYRVRAHGEERLVPMQITWLRTAAGWMVLGLHIDKLL